jgi:ABC-type glycerol-3-phosphate transport system permease component
MMDRSIKLTTALEIAVLVIFAIVMLFPVLWML